MTLLSGESGGTGNSGASSGQGAQGNSQGSSSGQSGTGAAGQAGGSAGGSQTSWRDTLPEDIRSNPALRDITDVGNLAKSYLHAQGLVGKKGAFVPDAKASDEDWGSFFKQIGVPELDKYEIKVPQGDKLDDATLKGFRETCHKMGLLPKQAQGLLDWQLGFEKTSAADATKAANEAIVAGIDGLKKQWGEGWDKQVATARLATREAGIDGFEEWQRKTGMGNDPTFLKLMAKVGSWLGEDRIRGEAPGAIGQTRDEVQGEIDRIMSDPKHAYFDSGHQGHARAVKQMEVLYQKLHT